VVLQHRASQGPQRLTIHRRRLLDDRGEGDHDDHAIQLVLPRVGESEGERGQRLAAAGRHGQREHVLRLGGLGDGGAQHVVTQRVERA
jgi:hypothetical protein